MFKGDLECLLSIKYTIKNLFTHLDRPPPVSGVHLIINTAHSFVIGKVSLRGKNKILMEIRIAIKCSNRCQNIPIVKFENLVPNSNLSAQKRRTGKLSILSFSFLVVLYDKPRL